jgi:hypothetical protein
MVTRVMPVYQPDFSNQGRRGTADDNKKRPQRNPPFKEALARALAGTANAPVIRK